MKSLIATAVIGAGALMVTAPPAAASESQPAPTYRCQLFASEPKVSADGHEITGLGKSMCTGTGWQNQKLVVTIEGHPLPFLYTVLAQASTDFSSSSSLQQTVSWPCTFTGTGTYTIETSWYGENGAAYSFKYPAQSLNLDCTD